MVLDTLTVSLAVTPAVINTFISHYTRRKPLAGKPTAHISYHEGLQLIRQFLLHASHHTVEDLQRFTSQWVPHPSWVKVDEVKIGEDYTTQAAEALQAQLGPHGIEQVGGKTWWQWRQPRSELKAEWIEMRADYIERKKSKENGKRVILYVHGGGYFFGSVDEHRYQMQRHARKLKARVFARYVLDKCLVEERLTSSTRYRLAPQFPFPCGLHDCLATYMYLLTIQDPTTIVLAGDSAGAGMVVSMLVTLRDRGLPLPAGAILISPWVDLTHSFPSVAGVNPMDYIPPHGFHQRPSMSWPPPNSDELLAIAKGATKKPAHEQPSPRTTEQDAVQGSRVVDGPGAGTQSATATTKTPTANTIAGPNGNPSIMIDGKLLEIKDQIQMYTTNQLLTHPLVSPILQPSLGGLPPLLVLTGGGEMLRDEQIYLAHKAANPEKYPPGDTFLDRNQHDCGRDQIKRWKPTDVQLQVWDDLCHVAPTLSFTRPAKYMYRSIAQFGAWALARAQKTSIEILDDDDVSIISESASEEANSSEKKKEPTKSPQVQIGKAGDPLPHFQNHMIRQLVDRHGTIYPLQPASSLPGCCITPNEIGVVKEGPVRKWMNAKQQWDTKYASAKRRVLQQRIKEMIQGYRTFGDGEVPPPSALASRMKDMGREEKRERSWGMSLWSLWGSKHDKETMVREHQIDKKPEETIMGPDGAIAGPLHGTEKIQVKTTRQQAQSRSRSRRRTVTDEHQTDQNYSADEDISVAGILSNTGKGDARNTERLTPDPIAKGPTKANVEYSADGITTNTTLESSQPASPTTISSPTTQSPTIDKTNPRRPKIGGIAIPFSLKRSKGSRPVSNVSTTTITSSLGVPPTKEVHQTASSESGVAPITSDDSKQCHSSVIARQKPRGALDSSYKEPSG